MLYNVKEVSKCLGINIHLVYALIRKGLLPALKLGSLKVRRASLESFIWNNFFKSLLRLYLWRPIAENFLNNKEDYLYFTEKLYPFTKDKCKMMLITRKKPAKRRKKMVKKRTTSIPSPETSYIPPKIEKTEAEPIDLMPEAVMKQSLPESAPISPPIPESEYSMYPKKEQQEEPEKENTFYFEKAPDAVVVADEHLAASDEDMDAFTNAFAQLIDS